MNDLYCEKSVKTILIDSTGHILGRLASVVAKLLLNGQFVAVVNCTEAIKCGKMGRNVAMWESWKNKTCRSNPLMGQKHHKAPKAILFRTIRGMLPRKQWRGLGALRRLKVYDGVPPFHFYKPKLCIPTALASLRLKTETKRVTLGDFCTTVGWTRYEIVKKFENIRKDNENKLKDHQKKIEDIKIAAEKELRGKNDEFKQICKEIESLENY